jgi:hypothetical protein
MQIGLVQKNHYNNVLGGGELSTKYWELQANKEGHTTIYIDYHTKELPECDFYLVGDFTCHNQQVINKLLTKPFSIVVHNSLPWTGYEYIYSKAKIVWLLSQKHLDLHRPYLTNENLRLVMPYVEHNVFKPKNQDKIEGAELYIGTISNNKIGQSMVDYIETSGRQFHFYGEVVDFDYHNPNIFIFPKLETPQKVAETMQKYETFFWYLDRFGGYGRTLIEAKLCGMDLDVNKENFGIFDYNFKTRQELVDKLEQDLQYFWHDNLKAVHKPN